MNKTIYIRGTIFLTSSLTETKNKIFGNFDPINSSNFEWRSLVCNNEVVGKPFEDNRAKFLWYEYWFRQVWPFSKRIFGIGLRQATQYHHLYRPISIQPEIATFLGHKQGFCNKKIGFNNLFNLLIDFNSLEIMWVFGKSVKKSDAYLFLDNDGHASASHLPLSINSVTENDRIVSSMFWNQGLIE